MSGFRRAIRDYKFYNVLYNMLGEVKRNVRRGCKIF